MTPAPFHYARPCSVVEALDVLSTHGTAAKLLAGGQSLMPLMTRRIERPRVVIDINRISGLDQIEILHAHVRMGALVRQEQALRSPGVRDQIAGLAEALAWVANPVVRRRGTVIGNLVTNSPGSELPAVALALDAEFVLRYPHGEETVSAERLLGVGEPVPADVLVTHVLWPRRAGGAGFYEIARRHGHAPVVSCMVALLEGDCRVAVSGVCATGLSCPTMAELIARQFPNVPRASELARALRNDLNGPIYGDGHSSAQYRLGVLPVVSQRAAQLAIQATLPRAALAPARQL